MTETSLGIRLLFSGFDTGTGREACVSGSYEEYRLRCEAAGVEPSSESGYRIEKAASFQGIL